MNGSAFSARSRAPSARSLNVHEYTQRINSARFATRGAPSSDEFLYPINMREGRDAPAVVVYAFLPTGEI